MYNFSDDVLSFDYDGSKYQIIFEPYDNSKDVIELNIFPNPTKYAGIFQIFRNIANNKINWKECDSDYLSEEVKSIIDKYIKNLMFA